MLQPNTFKSKEFLSDEKLELPLQYDFSVGQNIIKIPEFSKVVQKAINTGITFKIPNTNTSYKKQSIKPKSQAEQAYLDQLIKDEIIIKNTPIIFIRHYFIRKPKKLRLIFDGRPINRLLGSSPSFKTFSPKRLFAQVLKSNSIAKIDLKDAFFNLHIHKNTQPYFGIRIEGKGDFCYTRLPFGLNWSPFICHLFCKQIATHLSKTHLLTATNFLDDFWFLDPSPEQYENLLQYLDKLGIKPNRNKSKKPNNQMEILGFHLRLIDNTVDIEKLILFLKQISIIRIRQLSIRKIYEIIGYINYFSYLILGLLHFLFPIYLEVKPLINSQDPSSYNNIISSKSIINMSTQILNFIQHRQYYPISIFSKHHPTFDVFTDATTTQLGIILPFGQRSIKTNLHNIYQNEALALYVAVLFIFCNINMFLPHTQFKLYTDNQALYYAIRKGASKINIVNYILRLTLMCTIIKNLKFKVYWISTEKNPADFLSRRKKSEPFSNILQNLGGCLRKNYAFKNEKIKKQNHNSYFYF
jgi:hypothetical protein